MRTLATTLAATAFVALGSAFAFAETAPAPAAPAAAPAGKGHALAACRPALDALCANVEKGGGRKIKCLKDNEAKLTPECKTALDTAIAAHAARKAAAATAPAGEAAPSAPAAK